MTYYGKGIKFYNQSLDAEKCLEDERRQALKDALGRAADILCKRIRPETDIMDDDSADIISNYSEHDEI